MLDVLREKIAVHELDKLKHMDWVYIQKHHKLFVSVSSVALNQNPNFGHHIEPYLYTLPESFSTYSRLFESFGMEPSFTRSQIVSILSVIKEEVHDDSPSSVDQEAVWSTVMAVLNWLTENGTQNVGAESHVYVPVESSSEWPDLRELHEPVYTDNDFLKNFISASESGSSRPFVHSRINQSLAKCLASLPSVKSSTSLRTLLEMQVKMSL